MIDILYFGRHEWVYGELAKAIKDAILKYGLDAQITTYGASPTAKFTIIIGSKPFMSPPPKLPYVYFESDHKDTPLRQRIKIPYKEDEFCLRSLHFFDYKEDLRDENIYYCPIGYSKHFDTNIKREELRDVFHMGRSGSYGFRNKFRADHNLWTTPTNVIGEERDKVIVTSKVNINSELYENYWFTPLHASLVIHKGKLLLQQDYGREEFNWYGNYLIPFTAGDFRGKMDYWINNNKERREFEAFVHKEVKEKHPFEKYFYEAMGDLLERFK